MSPRFEPQHLMLLFGGAVLVFGVLIIAVYFIQKSLSRTRKRDEAKPARVRVEDETGFALAAVKGVIAQLKAGQTATQERLIVAERRAEESVRKFELIAREIEHGLIVFDAQGFITFSNPLSRRLLAVDTWSRRRYSEIFSEMRDLSELIQHSFETGAEARKKRIEFQGPDGSERQVEVAVLPARDRVGALESVTCIFREAPPPGAQ